MFTHEEMRHRERNDLKYVQACILLKDIVTFCSRNKTNYQSWHSRKTDEFTSGQNDCCDGDQMNFGEWILPVGARNRSDPGT